MPISSAPRRRGRLLAVAGAAALLLAPAVVPTWAVGASPARPLGAAQAAPATEDTAPDPDLVRDLDAIMAASPPDSCLSVAIEGETAYERSATTPVVPASTLKLLTATAALAQLGGERRLETRVVGAAPVDGVVTGDLALVGGGDPTLVTDEYRLVRRIGADQPTTSLDALADEVVAAGVRRVTGRVVGDESRYDAVRTVPSWPERYTAQGQSGPLSALTVDDGYVLRPVPPEEPDAARVRDRSADPPADAARALTQRLASRGVVVDGALLAGAGPAPAGAVDLAVGRSAKLATLVGQMLLRSDNQIAELLTKELGHLAGPPGTTAAGTARIVEEAVELGVDPAGLTVVDGSGLDPGNRVTCDGLATILEATGGPDGALGPSLPVAGETGTLAARFREPPVAGRMRAKTGSLNGVTSLAGYVALPQEASATFAYVANAELVSSDVRNTLELLAAVLAGTTAPCPATGADGLVAPVGPYAGQVGTLAMFPLQSVLLPGAVLPLHVFEDRYRALVDRCLALDEDFGVVLISRGSEVGGQDQRTEVGTRARIVEAQQAPDGRWAVVALGMARFRVDAWLPDDPHPLAEVTEWPDPPARSGTGELFDAAAARLRRVLALRTELGEPGPAATVDLSVDPAVDDPSLASHRLVGLSPLGDLDRQRLLAAADIADRLAVLDGLLDEEEQVCRARLSQA